MISPCNFAPNTCAADATGCTGGPPVPGTPIQCWQVADCVPNGVSNALSCCIRGAMPPATVQGCGYFRSKGGSAVVCETTSTCAIGDVQICSSQADCPTGTMCVPGKWKIFDVGFCL
jgi:hypothetical protein